MIQGQTTPFGAVASSGGPGTMGPSSQMPMHTPCETATPKRPSVIRIDNVMSPVFDHAGSLQRMGNDPALFGEMVSFLHSDSPRWLAQVRAGLEQHKLMQVQHAAHTLKGLVSNFGASRAVSVAATVEHLAKQGEEATIVPLLKELQEAVEELQAALAPFGGRSEPAA